MNSKEALVVLEENSREVEEKDEFNVNLEENYAQNDEIQNDEPGSVHVIGDENDTNIQNAFDDEKPLKKEDEKSNEVHNGEKTLTIVKNESVGGVSDQEKDLQNNDEKRIDDNSGDKKSQYNNALKVPNDYDQEDDEEADLDENNKYCPTKCASSDMMICAHCQHGVFRTFMSVCHLRAFTCAHTDEKLSLVSRKPCVQSAPFLYDLPETKGRIEHSDDRVLQFIKCRRDGKLGKDPQCNFH
ncbi:unnamed protein product [Leptosia nina]|uniref:Uncharacterized protein n=1 Tax=Leptosia nina TaxID=320188 RepID=A0AAV1JH21_9NEOP